MDRESLRSHLIEACSLMAIEIRTDQVEQLLRFAAMVEAGNQRMNLTRIESEKEFAVKHLVDCLAVQKTNFGFSGRGIDVGSGAGFPGVVIASCLTTDPVVLVDSLEKRVGFLREVSKALQLSHVECVHSRAEDLARNPSYRERFQWATARAVAPLPALLEYCVPFLAVGGHFIAFKGSSFPEELKAAGNAVKLLNASLIQQYHFQLPFDMGERWLAVFRKEAATSAKYPRKAGIPNKKPL
ncbi:MAG: 16S rRNA (guanine(527)-N(7))-methyltransferase RsmG [Limnochordia bacterium]